MIIDPHPVNQPALREAAPPDPFNRVGYSTRLLILIAFLFTTIVLIVRNIPRTSLWYDEALTTWVARDSWATLWTWCTQIDIQVPFHYVLLRLWSDVAGDSEFVLRLLSAFGVVIAFAAVIRIGKELKATGIGVAAVLFMAMSWGVGWIAYEVRAYAVGFGLYAWATAFLLILVRRYSLRILLIYCVLMVAVLYTHYTGMGALAAHLGFLVVRAYRARSRREWMLPVRIALICGLCFAPMLPIILTRSGADRSYYQGWQVPPWYSAGTVLGFALTGREDISNAAPWLAVGFGIAALSIGIIGLRHANRMFQRAAHLGLWVTLVPTALTAFTVFFRPKLAGRYAWPAWIGLYLLLALGVYMLALLRTRRFRLTWQRLAFVGLLAVIYIPRNTIEQGHPPNSDFAGAFRYICENGTPDDVIVLRDGTLFVAYEYYGKRPPCDQPRYAIGAPMALITNVESALRVRDLQILQDTIVGAAFNGKVVQRFYADVWVISWQGDITDPQGIALSMLDQLTCELPTQRAFGDVTVHRYQIGTPMRAMLPCFDRVGLGVPPAAQSKPQLTPLPNGAMLTELNVISPPDGVRHGDVVIVHAYWSKGAVLNPDLRVSARITSVDNGWTYYQIDQPPAGWKYYDDRWIEGDPALGRYELPINDDVPAGEVMIRYVIYDAGGKFAPITLEVGKITVVP